MKNSVVIKRIYDVPKKSDGYRILVDKLWPRGVKKTEAAIDLWLKEIAPSDTLRKWFNHDPEKWKEFQLRYTKELKEKSAPLDIILKHAHKQHVTLLYGAKDSEHNHALVLKKVLDTHLK